MAGHAKYDWEKVLALCKELAESCDSYKELAKRISARIEKQISRTTLTQGIKRETEMEFSIYEDFQVWARGGERLSPLSSSILNYLKKGSNRDTAFSMLEMCEQFDRSPSSIKDAVKELQDNDYSVKMLDDGQVLLPKVVAPTCNRIPAGSWMHDRVHRFGIISDTHLANRCARLDVLESIYDWYASEGIEIVLHAGNLIDGEFRFNRHELVAHGIEGQIAYAAKNYPQREGVVTKFISADDHEGWWAHDTGLDIGRHMQSTFVDKFKRTDLEWIGHVEVDIELHPDNPQAVLRVFHPGGGTAYADSYSIQKHVESWQSGNKPTACVFGHYHKHGLFYPREVWCMGAGCVEDQTMFMRKKKIAAHVGASILEIHMTRLGGIGEFVPRLRPFYDRGYYESNWDYLSMWFDD